MLGLGLGRAILYLREHDARPYRDIILHTCTHWTGYDQQVEGTRTPYLMTVLDATGEIERYVEPILAAFRTATDRRDQGQLICLASELALEVLADPTLGEWRRSSGVEMLRSNLEPGDEALLIDLPTSPRGIDELHWMGMGVEDVLEVNPAADAVPVLFALYEHDPCTNCRERAVERLRRLGALPNWMIEECRYDASEFLRKAADTWARGEEPAG